MKGPFIKFCFENRDKIYQLFPAEEGTITYYYTPAPGEVPKSVPFLIWAS